VLARTWRYAKISNHLCVFCLPVLHFSALEHSVRVRLWQFSSASAVVWSVSTKRELGSVQHQGHKAQRLAVCTVLVYAEVVELASFVIVVWIGCECV
jgi:hypothetical protein